MAVDLHATFAGGGRPLIDLLGYCVFSVQMDAVFCYLARDFQSLPAARKATALYEGFCSPHTPARVSCHRLLPPFDPRIAKAIEPFRPRPEPASALPALPPRYLFDPILAELERASASMKEIARNYDPGRTPLQNLPGGRMTEGQRQFVESVWHPQLRPFLVEAGFFRIANVG